jgi:transposase, IS30 family
VFDLVRSGVSLKQAAVLGGVSYSAVVLWLSEVGGVIPRSDGDGGRYLGRDERYEIARLADAGQGPRAIGRQLGRAASTISRELRRNAYPRTDRYEPERANTLAHRRRRRPKTRKLERNPTLRAWVQSRLDQRDSPQQIAGRLRLEFGDDTEMRVSHESIYQAIYVRSGGQLRREVRAHLRTGRLARKPRATRTPRGTGRGAILDAVSIHDRPEEVEDRLVPGHHEGDLIMGSVASNSAIGTIVERVTGFVSLIHLPDGHTADLVAAAIAAQVTSLPAGMAKTITWDRGREMSAHARLTELTGMKVYFADPYSPWQRGTNENTNGLLREFFPKGSDLSIHTAADLQAAADNLNDRPRKRLGYRTPNEVLTSLIEQDINQRVATFT